MGAIALQVGGTIRGSEPPKSSCGSWTCKPNSVCSTSHRVGPRSRRDDHVSQDGHSSGPRIAARLKRPTRKS